MRKYWKRHFCALLFVFMVGVVAASGMKSADTLNQLEHDALSGSPSAANELAYYFKDNEKARYFWIAIAAENGDTNAQFNYWRRLTNSENRLLRQRALFWLRKAADSGDEIAKRSLRDVEQGAE